MHVRKIKEGKEQEEAFIEKFKAELKRVNTFFASEVNGTIQRLASLLQRTQDYINSGVYNMFGIDSLHRALSTLNRRYVHFNLVAMHIFLSIVLVVLGVQIDRFTRFLRGEFGRFSQVCEKGKL